MILRCVSNIHVLQAGKEGDGKHLQNMGQPKEVNTTACPLQHLFINCIYLSTVYLSIYLCMVHYVLEMVLIAAGLSISSSVGVRRERIDEKAEILRIGERHLLQGGKDPHDL